MAAELVFTGRLMPGSEAAQLGLINRAVPAAALDDVASTLVAEIASGPTVALRLSKEILLAGGDFDAVLAHEARQLRAVFTTADLREGITAFQQRRKPEFSGR
jgi:enoyl-CoA hydratase/carnithine racemase